MTLKEFRKNKNLSHQALAKFLGVGSASTVYRWEVGERLPKKQSMQLIKNKTKGKVKPADFYV